MKTRYKIILLLLIIACSVWAYQNISDYIFYKRFEAYPTKNLTAEQKERRKEMLREGIERTMGITMVGHGVKVPGIGIKTKKIYEFSKILSDSDLELLSEMYIDDYFGKFKEYFLIDDIFLIRGDKAITILEKKIIDSNLTDERKKNMLEGEFSTIVSLKKQSKTKNTFWLIIQKYKEEDRVRTTNTGR